MTEMENTQTLSFEEALNRLEMIVGQLESGTLPLEECMRAFEEGMKLNAFCTSKLAEAEKKIEVLVRNKETGALTWEPQH